MRLVRSAMLDTLQSQYVMVARAKGLSEGKVLYKHALRNCAIPLITYFGLQFGGLLVGIVSVAGAVVIGVVMGLISGYYRGVCDVVVMRFADVQLALPFILLAITFITILGGSLTNTIILLTVLGLSLLGDWLRDSLDPTGRTSR
ncbi:hypothetical protein TSO352_05300 [Azospirillum sp. TSO35-2]|nr:hypothetical protein TSO352_05300 [Azospirillum sp. TSO35-2]